jgi:acyl-coenzyme A synthetase/AMP-(fatty) acid ligase
MFLIENDESVFYDKLLEDINSAEYYYKGFKTDDLYAFFLNLIVAIISDKDIVLLDWDLSDSELIESDLKMFINKKEKIDNHFFLSFECVIKKLLVSRAEITIFTSGTTGQPKKINHTILNLTRGIREGERYRNQIWGFAYNPTHIAGLQVFFQALVNKNTLVNIFSKNRSYVYDSIQTYGITNISATPTFFRLLMPFKTEFKTVKRITFGGEKSDLKLHKSIINIFPSAKVNNIYASTEAGSLLISKGENFIIPPDLKSKLRVECDELLVHMSLLGKSENIIFHDEYYKTGDLVEWIDETNGLFRFTSRKNELINIGGYKVNPSEVEKIIQEIDQIQQVVVYGKPNSVLGKILCADIKLIENGFLNVVQVRSYLSEKIQDFKIPRRIKFVDQLTVTRTGKLKRL